MAVNDLSDGYRSTLSMIADIAYRMAILNPQLFDDVLTQTPGVVLIDEVDLHLHPLWQQRILKDLMNIFPNVQFIVTTHAPAVIGSVKKENLLVLTDNRTAFMPVCEVYGSDANSICVVSSIILISRPRKCRLSIISRKAQKRENKIRCFQ